MNEIGNPWPVAVGMVVIGADEVWMGDVVALRPGYLVVANGDVFQADVFVPLDAVTSVSDRIYLTVTGDEALVQGWETAPDDDGGAATGTFGSQASGPSPAPGVVGTHDVGTPSA